MGDVQYSRYFTKELSGKYGIFIAFLTGKGSQEMLISGKKNIRDEHTDGAKIPS